MRTYVTLAQIALLTSFVNSAFAVPAPAPQVHDKRAISGKGVGIYKQDVKENALAGLVTGILSAFGIMGQKQLINGVSNSRCISTPFHTLPSQCSSHPGDKPSDFLSQSQGS